MFNRKKIALLEFDSDTTAIIQPSKKDYDFVLPNKCIAIFFRDIVQRLASLPCVKEIGRVTWETGDVIYYSYLEGHTELCFYHSWVGSAISSAVLDLTISLGATEIISIGGCGVLGRDNLDVNILIPIEGVRDEGTSFHYFKPTRTIFPSEKMVNRIKCYFEEEDIPYRNVKTWTTDGFYRETKQKTQIRKKEGCSTVDMEFTAMCAVAKFRNVEFAAIFYCGDVVEYDSYDERDWQNNTELRNYLFLIAKNIIKGEKK